MRFFQTSHYRLINLLAAVCLIGSWINYSRHEAGFLPEYAGVTLGGAAIFALFALFVRPASDLGPIKGPHLSLLHIRLVSGVLLTVGMFSLANYYLLEPGYFQPYKKEVLAASFAVIGLFVVTYGPSAIEMMTKTRLKNDHGA